LTVPATQGAATAGAPSPQQQEALTGQLLSEGGNPQNIIRFEAAGGVWDVAALDKLYVFVAANTRWRATAQATALTGDAGVLPADRLSARHWYSGGQYVNLSAPLPVASGGRQVLRLVNTLYFRAHLEPADRAGTYHGTLQFTGLIAP